MPTYIVTLLVKEQDEYFARSLVEYMIDHGLIGEDKKRVELKRIREAPAPRPSRYECLVCGEVFDTRTGKGKMHIASHGYNFQWSLEKGKARPL